MKLELLKWVEENNIAKDPDKLGRIYDEARHRFGVSRFEANELTSAVMKEILSHENKER